MPIEMPRGLPFSVDTWTPGSGRKRHHFLTHAHGDHLQGLAARSFYPIYATRVTKILTLGRFPQIDGEWFVEVEVGTTVQVSDPEGDFSVTAFDANHCPGAVMFLFEGVFGNLLHTGDCRLSPDCLQKLPLRYIARKGSETCLDYLFLDCTFGRATIDMPTKESAIRQVIDCIWKHPDAPVVYLACDLLGQEDVLVEVSRAFGSKIYVDKNKCEVCFNNLSLISPEILSEDKSCRFQVIGGFRGLHDGAIAKLAEARAEILPEPLFIRPSAQWYARDDGPVAGQQRRGLCLSEAERDGFGVWHVCYSTHSSRQELEWALQLLRPQWVVSTTPPCRAMELTYVKDHCFKTRIRADDPVLRLFGVDARKFAASRVSSAPEVSGSVCVPVVEGTAGREGVDEPPAEKRSRGRPLTLFGRARLGPEEEEDPSRSSQGTEAGARARSSSGCHHRGGTGAAAVVGRETSADLREEAGVLPVRAAAPSAPDTDVGAEEGAPRVGSSGAYHDSLRRLYRSMNVPVPRPLPSLSRMAGASKRSRIGLRFPVPGG